MSVYIVSARIDEHGNARGGKAGDQTGKEVSTQKWYKHKKGWVVLRPINSARAENIALDGQFAADNKNIGYDQDERLTLYKEAEKVGFNCAKVTKPCETDCSALVRVCLAFAGIKVKNFTTANEVDTLMATGEFIKLTDKKYTDSDEYLLRGDILVTKTQGHTAIVLCNGKKATPSDNRTISEIVVTSLSVYIREAPYGKVLGIGYTGDKFPYISTDTTTGWYKIKYKNSDAFITNKYTSPIYK